MRRDFCSLVWLNFSFGIFSIRWVEKSVQLKPRLRCIVISRGTCAPVRRMTEWTVRYTGEDVRKFRYCSWVNSLFSDYRWSSICMAQESSLVETEKRICRLSAVNMFDMSEASCDQLISRQTMCSVNFKTYPLGLSIVFIQCKCKTVDVSVTKRVLSIIVD